MSNRRAILILFAILVLTGVLNVVCFWKGTEASTARRVRLLDEGFVPARLTLASGGVERLALERATDGWRLVKPYASSANDAAVERLLDVVAFTPISETISDAELLRRGHTCADYGVDETSLVLSLSDASRTHEFAFGSFTASTQEVYVACDGSPVLSVVPASVRSAVDLSPEDFRRRAIFAYGPESVVSFLLKRPGAPALDCRRAGTDWRANEAIVPTERVDAILKAFASAQAVDFIWPTRGTNASTVASMPLLTGYGLDSETGIGLTLRCTDGTEHVFTVGSAANEKTIYLLADAGHEIVTVGSSLKDSLKRNETPSAEAHVFPFAEADVTSFSLAESSTVFVLSRAAEGAWRMESPIVAPADATVATEILGRILALTSTDLSEQGLAVSVNTNAQSVTVAPSFLMGTRRMESLRAAEILKQDSALVKRLVQKMDGRQPTAVLYSRERRAWNVETSARQGAVDEDAVARVLTALQSLRAIAVVRLKASEDDLRGFGLDKPFATIAIDQEKEDAVRRNILIGGEAEGGRYATVGTADAIFILPTETVTTLLGEWVGE